jgi:phosphoglycerate dehydrogenase-like enzyme
MKKLFIHDTIDPDGLEQLQAVDGLQVDIVVCDDEDPDWTAPPATNVLFSCNPPTNLDALRDLELMHISSVGYTQLLGLGLPQRGVRACNASGVFDVPIGEWNVAMMIILLRDVRRMIRNQEARHWERPAVFQRELSGMTVGFWGYGGIARETARLCKAMHMQVHTLVRSGVRNRALVYCVAGTGDPAGKLNPARGPLIQEQALIDALRDGEIAGAALDTHYEYPLPPEHPLWAFPNVIISPHVSGSNLSPYFKKRLWDILVTNMKRYVADEPLLNELDPKDL